MLWIVSGIAACCDPSPPEEPEIATPDDCDLLRIRTLDINEYDFYLIMRNCRDDSGQHIQTEYPVVIRDTNSVLFRNCTYGKLEGIDFNKESFIAAYLGSINDVVYFNMNYKVFINHRKKEILIKSIVVGTGECSGCCLSGWDYYRFFTVPKIPDHYTVRVDITD